VEKDAFSNGQVVHNIFHLGGKALIWRRQLLLAKRDWGAEKKPCILKSSWGGVGRGRFTEEVSWFLEEGLVRKEGARIGPSEEMISLNNHHREKGERKSSSKKEGKKIISRISSRRRPPLKGTTTRPPVQNDHTILVEAGEGGKTPHHQYKEPPKTLSPEKW